MLYLLTPFDVLGDILTNPTRADAGHKEVHKVFVGTENTKQMKCNPSPKVVLGHIFILFFVQKLEWPDILFYFLL